MSAPQWVMAIDEPEASGVASRLEAGTVAERLKVPTLAADSRPPREVLRVLRGLDGGLGRLSFELQFAELRRQLAWGLVDAAEYDKRVKAMITVLERDRASGRISADEFKALRATARGRPISSARQIAFAPATTPARAVPAGPPKLPAHPRIAPRWAVWGAARDGARVVITRAQVLVTLTVLALVAVTVFARPLPSLIACLGAITAVYVLIAVHKISLLVRGERAAAALPAQAPVAMGDDLPLYTVLVPLHREGGILRVLIERLRLLDYPEDRLEVLLLIESDDEETRAALSGCSLPAFARALILPLGHPRTKPRALNIGLHAARGEFVVVYDAEDRPEPDQLRKAVAAFRSLPDDVVCLQGRLNYYNRHHTLLTRMFAVEYVAWYDHLLPGLAHTNDPEHRVFLPLGGSTNHFRAEAVRQLGGWDPYNVTEDCDLGARIGRQGLGVAMLDSTTWEEAVPHVGAWVRQRSRWIKGYLQTYLVHMRHPLQLLHQLGWRGFFDFQMLIGASALVLLLNPLMWALTAVYLASKGTELGGFIQSLLPAGLYYPALLSLVVGNFVLFYANTYTCVRHNYMDLTRYTLLTPVYWMLMSLGAWAGLISLVRNPFYWAKTDHGTSIFALSDATRLNRWQRDQLATLRWSVKETQA
jgi:cellulose synthase/poly-beta-1,6-N-acetylglucosamine synthase-like glycosyltransferase